MVRSTLWRRLVAIVGVAVLSALGFASARASSADPWSDLRFLIGEWDAEPGPGLVSGRFTLAEDLGGAILVRRNHAEYAAKPGEKEGTVHDDVMFVFSEGGHHRAVFLDPEGHVIRYAVTVAPHGATFESDLVAGAPRYKLEYEDRGSDRVLVTFSIAPPGGDYKAYLSGVVKRHGT